MLVSTLLFDLDIDTSFSLKDKRRILKSLKTRLRNKFNISTAEVGEKELWNKGYLAVAIVGDDRRFIDVQIQEVVNFIDEFDDVVIFDVRQEWF